MIKFNVLFIICPLILFLAIILRLTSLGTSPLFDTTEARYASIAQKIILDNDWITLKLPELNQTFLGKPPLSFWLIALSYKVFGINEFAARFPNFLAALLTLLFTFLIARKFYDLRTAFLTPLILISAIFFFIQGGTVSLDMLVCLILTASIWAYLNIILQNKKLIYEILLGIFFGFGMLNKGPLAIVLFLGIIALLSVWAKRKDLILKPNWLIILGFAILISLPWYLAVQQRNPDFFEYFFLNEHLYRYLKPDYGDRYGTAHHQPYGMAWIYVLGAFMPWTFFLLPMGFNLWQRRKNQPFSFSLKFLLVWAIFSPLFFTFARSILMTYIIGSLPPLAILCARTLSKAFQKFKENQSLQISNFFLNFVFNPFNSLSFIAISVIVILAGAISYSAGYPYSMKRSLVMFSTICMALLAVFVGYIASRRNLLVLRMLFFISALGIPVVMSFWYGPLSHSVGDSKSMKAVIEDLERKIPDYNKHDISFLGESAPYSWYFYTQAIDTNQALNIHNLVKCPIHEDYNHAPENDKTLIIVTEAHLNLIQEKYPMRYAQGLISKEGKYYVFGQGRA